jgi:hypothetical protein
MSKQLLPWGNPLQYLHHLKLKMSASQTNLLHLFISYASLTARWKFAYKL